MDQINVSANRTTCYSQLSDGFMRKKVKDSGGDNQNDIYCVLTLNPQILATRSINEHVSLVILSQQTKV